MLIGKVMIGMAVDGHLNFDTKIDESGFNEGINKLNGLAKSGVAAVGKALAGVTAALGAGAVAGVKYNATIEQYQTSFEVMTGSAEKAAEIVQQLTKIGAETPFEMTGLAETTQLLMNYGFTADDAMDKMMMLGDISQGSADKMNRIAMAYGQMSSAGKVQLEDIKQMIEAGFNPLQEISQTTGESMESLYNRISKGTISIDEITASMERSTSAGGKYFQSMEKQSQTVSGQLSTLKDNVMQLLGSLSSGISDVLGGDILPAINEMLGNLNDAFQTGGFQGFLDELGSAVPAIQGITDAIGTLTEKLQGMSTDELTSLGKTALTIGAAVPAFMLFSSGIDTVKTATQGFNQITDGVISNVTKLPGTFKGIGSTLSGLGKNFSDLGSSIALPFQDLGKKIAPGIKNAGASIVKTWMSGPSGDLTNSIAKTVSNVAGKFGELGPALAKKFPGITSKLSAIPAAFASLGGKVGAALSKVSGQVGTYAGIIGDSLSPILKKAAGFAPQFLKYMNIAGGIGIVVAGLGLLYNAFGGEIDNVLLMVQTKGPQVITDFCSGIAQRIPELMAQGAALIQNLLSAITANIPSIVSGGTQVITALVTGLSQQLPQLIPSALQVVLTLVQALLSNAPQLISAGLQLMLGLAQGIISAIPQLISAIPSIIESLVSGISQSLPMIILAGIQLLVALVTGIIQAVPQLLAAIPQIFQAFVDGITSVDWLEVGKTILTAIKDGILSIGSSLWDAVKGIFTGGSDEAAEEGKKTGQKYAEGVDSTTINAQTSAANVANATTNSFATTLDAGGVTVSTAAMTLGTNANTGLSLANVPGAFSANAQSAASGMSSTLNANAVSASSAGLNLGTNAVSGLNMSGMSGSYSAAGTQAGQSLGASLTGQTGTVSAAAGAVSSSASGVDLSGAYANAGSQAMQSLADSISSGSGTVTSAASAAAEAAISGLKQAQMPEKGKTEGNNFVKSLSDAIKAGTGTTRAAVSAVMDAAKAAANGLGSAGTTAGLQFSQGLANGIISGRNGVAQAAAQVATAAVQAAQANLEIHSPSKIAEYFGRMFDSGLARGIRKNTDLVLDSMGYMTNTLSRDTEAALMGMKKQTAMQMTAAGTGMYRAATGRAYKPEIQDSASILDEWEKRQKRLNDEMSDRPFLIDSRQANRGLRRRGDIKV